MFHVENCEIGEFFQSRNILVVQIADNGQIGNCRFIVVGQQFRQGARSFDLDCFTAKDALSLIVTSIAAIMVCEPFDTVIITRLSVDGILTVIFMVPSVAEVCVI